MDADNHPSSIPPPDPQKLLNPIHQIPPPLPFLPHPLLLHTPLHLRASLPLHSNDHLYHASFPFSANRVLQFEHQPLLHHHLPAGFQHQQLPGRQQLLTHGQEVLFHQQIELQQEKQQDAQVQQGCTMSERPPETGQQLREKFSKEHVAQDHNMEQYMQPEMVAKGWHELCTRDQFITGKSSTKDGIVPKSTSGATAESDSEYVSISTGKSESVEDATEEDVVRLVVDSNCTHGSQSPARNEANRSQLSTSCTPEMERLQNHLASSHPELRDLQTNNVLNQSSKSSTTGLNETLRKKGKKKLKQLQFQLDYLAHQKLMKLVSEQHEGSLERFVTAAVNANATREKQGRKHILRKPALSKWKRTRFDQLKGNETRELTLAFKTLTDSTLGVKASAELLETPWQELTMGQIEQILEETKKMLLLNEKVHDCPHLNCGKRFSTPGNLRDHLNEHSGERPYACTFEDCTHRFRSKQLLCRHAKKHERAHRCMFDGCNKRFAFRERLIVHQKTHSDERPLTCSWAGCGKTFKWANSLHGHMRTHTGEKPFQCSFAGCGRLFGYKVDVTRHQRTHFGQPARSSH